MLVKFVSFFVRRARLTAALWVILVAGGLLSYFSFLPREGFPSVDIPFAVVSGNYFVDDIDRVDGDVLEPLSGSAESVPEVTAVQTFARTDSFSLIAEFESSVTSAEGVEMLREALAGARIPDEAELSFQAIDAARFLNEYDLLVAVHAGPDASATDLEAAASGLVPELVAVGAIDGAEVVDLVQTGTDPTTGEAISRQTRFNEVTVEVDGRFEFRPSVAVGVVAASGTDSLALAEAADAVLAGPGREALPEGFSAFVAADYATQIRSQLSSLQQNVATGVLAVAVVSLILISWRASAITALFILTVMATAMLVLWVVGISLNTISLFGLILTLGLFVDDAVVIVESIDAFRDEASTPLGVIQVAIRRVGAASASGTMTTVLVFAPMLFVSGVLGDFIRQLPLTVILALITSLILSFVFIPVAARFVVLGEHSSGGLLATFEARLGRGVASLPAIVRTNPRLGLVVASVGVGLSVVLFVVGLQFAGKVGFDIFPASKDSDLLTAEFTFDPGVTLNEARLIANGVDQAVADELGDLLDSGYLSFGSANSAFSNFNLVSFRDRGPKSPELVERLQPLVADVPGARVALSQASSGPPESEFPFQAQIFSEDLTLSEALAADIVASIDGQTFEKPNGESFTVIETRVALTDVVAREDGERLIEVRARFDDDEVSSLLDVVRTELETSFDEPELTSRGLAADSLRFDFGQESENEESFQSTIVAFFAALILMGILLAIQFRSLLQPILVFLAIPFSFFGVFLGLWITDNPISFFVMLGLIGLIGIAVNNTILLTDFANQERRAGADRVTAIEVAVRRRFRPLVSTSLTTVAGLLPLALSDPFWEALAFTIIFGLLSSTLLVVLSFPYYYLLIEWIRDLVRAHNPLRRRTRT
ncbi:MAG: efflux RND transporter permease subunit [Actinomycetia bacterium]|nr:efflux RND transporter permease subunit [Actinomycetes bacterium]